MNLIKPKKLTKGDTISIIAPSGPVDRVLINNAKKYFETNGYNVVLGKNILKKDRYLAGSDDERVNDIHDAFADKNVNAVICARGGYGAIRLLNKIDFTLIKNNPKIFCGYSDITALSLMFLKYAGLITYSGPMAQSDFSSNIPDKAVEKSFFNVLSGFSETYKSTKIIKTGKSEGILWGGNLSTIVSLCGLDIIPDEKFIFFLEDISEPVYKIDKMLSQLINIKNFRTNISAIAFGEFSQTDSSEWLNKLMTETAEILNIPAACGFKFTHNTNKQTIPIGSRAEYNSGTLILSEIN